MIKFLDVFFKKVDLSGAYDAWRSSDQIKRTGNQSIHEYISKFTTLYINMKKRKIELPQTVLAFKLLDFSGLQNYEKTTVLTAVDYSKNEKLLDQMMKSLKKFFGTQSLSEMTSHQGASVKLEPTYHTEKAFYESFVG